MRAYKEVTKEMGEQKTVPLRGLRCPRNDFRLCRMEECGMWDSDMGCCAVVSIAQHLKWLRIESGGGR